VTHTPTPGTSAFADLFTPFLAELFALDPVFATETGDHARDSEWPDLTEAGRLALLAFIARWETRFEALDGLAADDAVDRDLVLGRLAALRFDAETLRDDATDPMTWIYALGGGLFSLLARDFAPLAERLTSVAGRLEGIPSVLDAARSALVGTADRPVGRFQTETAIGQLAGIGSLIDDALEQASAAGGDPEVAAIQPRLAAAAETARAAVAAFGAHLREVVLPASAGEGRLGRDLFTQKMRHTMQSDELTPERILAQAEREFTAVRAEMVRLARDLWPAWQGSQPLPDDDQAIVRGVLDAVAAEHPRADDKLDYCRAENERIEAFCRATDLVGLSDERLVIQWTPGFLRSFGNAMLIAPGPLEHGLDTFFAITPIPADWSEEQRESALREDNDRMLRLITIHEAVPGHYLQAAYANRCPSLARAVFSSGLYAEGWAVYVTQVMMDVGYGADDPALLLTHWKYYLRCVINAIIDARIHCDGMTEDEAVALMVDGGFQETAEARAKYARARLSSTQLSTYFAGSMEMWAIELDARRRAAGDASLQARSLPGGFGPTPGFRYRAHLESVMAHGAPPTALLKRLVAR
jgi:uncharacterized protein (DUF885 family)